MNGKGLAISSFSGEPQATACFNCELRIVKCEMASGAYKAVRARRGA